MKTVKTRRSRSQSSSSQSGSPDTCYKETRQEPCPLLSRDNTHISSTREVRISSSPRDVRVYSSSKDKRSTSSSKDKRASSPDFRRGSSSHSERKISSFREKRSPVPKDERSHRYHKSSYSNKDRNYSSGDKQYSSSFIDKRYISSTQDDGLSSFRYKESPSLPRDDRSPSLSRDDRSPSSPRDERCPTLHKDKRRTSSSRYKRLSSLSAHTDSIQNYNKQPKVKRSLSSPFKIDSLATNVRDTRNSFLMTDVGSPEKKYTKNRSAFCSPSNAAVIKNKDCMENSNKRHSSNSFNRDFLIENYKETSNKRISSYAGEKNKKQYSSFRNNSSLGGSVESEVVRQSSSSTDRDIPIRASKKYRKKSSSCESNCSTKDYRKSRDEKSSYLARDTSCSSSHREKSHTKDMWSSFSVTKRESQTMGNKENSSDPHSPPHGNSSISAYEDMNQISSPREKKQSFSPIQMHVQVNAHSSENQDYSLSTQKKCTTHLVVKSQSINLNCSFPFINGGSPIENGETNRDKEFSCSPSSRGSLIKESMRTHLSLKRKRSASPSSSDDLANNDYEQVALSLKKRRLSKYNKFSESSSQVITDKVFENKIHSLAVVPVVSPFRTPVGKRQPPFPKNYMRTESHHSGGSERLHRNILLKQNRSTYSDGDSSMHEEHQSDRERFNNTGFSSSPVTSGKQERSAPDCSWLSPNFLTPGRQSMCHSEESPRLASPSFISNLSPRSTLRGLDQPHPWALDLVARSEGYNSTFIDSHCHIDLLYDRLGICHRTKFYEFRKMIAYSFPINFEGCVAVFCYPKTYDPTNPQDKLFQTLATDDAVWFALGCHPKSATEFMTRHEHGLRKALGHPKVVALGEIGLDYSGTFYRHAETQKRVLRLQLQMAMDLKLPLVIHCRDAYDDCLAILMEMVPRTWQIHLHCFCGNTEVANLWLGTFPNLYIGLTPVITYRSAHDSTNTARNIPLNRILLETDSPYFVPGSIKEGRVQVSHPGFALFTAERIAELKNVTVDTVLHACRINTQTMYGV